MKKKRWVMVTVALVLIGGYGAAIYAEVDQPLQQEQLANANDKKNIQRIAENVLADTGRSDLYDLGDAEDVTVYYGDVRNSGAGDVVISVGFGPKNTVVAAYTPDGSVYEYIGDIGAFYDVQNIEFVPVPSLGQDVVIVQEFANQNVGAYEASSLLKGYVYEEKGFQNVLNTPAKIQASWNYLWDNADIEDESKWHRVTEETERTWKQGDTPSLDVLRNQTYLEAKDVNSKQLPRDGHFSEKDSRKLIETFYWSDRWKRFIVGEAVEKTTGKPVAVLENQNASPYAIAGFQENGYRIIREDGSQDVVKESQLEFTNPPKMEEKP